MRPQQAWGIILAAGRGLRFGGPKQFAEVCAPGRFARARGRSLLWYSISAFERCPGLSGWTVVTVPERIAAVRRLCKRAGYRKLRAVVPGGRTRAGSVRQGLETLPRTGLVAVHDAARPLITPAMLTMGLGLCGRVPVIYACPIHDTIKQVESDRIHATVDRAGLWAAQTPQFFSLALLRRAYRQAGSEADRATDDCQLVERLGVRPRVITADGPNPKVTRPADLDLVRRLL